MADPAVGRAEPAAPVPREVSEARLRRREEARRRLYRQRRLAAAGLVCGVLLVVAVALSSIGEGGSAAESTRAASERAIPAVPPPVLPRGGRQLLPDYRVVAFYGAPQAEELGVLGIGPPSEVARELEQQAKPYEKGGRPIMPAFELIATIASAHPGEDGKYRSRQSEDTVRRYLHAARQAKALLVLDIQPGREDFVTEVRAFEKFLAEPDVSLALDPEWSMDPGEVPGKVIGSTDAAKVNEVSAYLSEIVRRHNLPEKLLLIHQFTEGMIENKRQVVRPPGVAVAFNVDGFGDPPNKLAKYREFTRGPEQPTLGPPETRPAGPQRPEPREPDGPAPGASDGPAPGPPDGRAPGAPGGRAPVPAFGVGYKLFYKEDTDLMSPADVLRLRPQPDVVVYE